MQVEDFTDLSKLSTEKLLKLRDVAFDYYDEMQQAEVQAWQRYQQIVNAIEERNNAEKVI